MERKPSEPRVRIESLDWHPFACSFEGGNGNQSSGSTDIANPTIPELTCTGFAGNNYGTLTNRAMWAIVAYQGSSYGSSYQRGCVNECGQFGKNACPGYTPSAAIGFECDLNTAFDFGQIRCGCSVNYAGGSDCHIGCASGLTMSQPGFDYRSRNLSSIWMCADRALSMPLRYESAGGPGVTRFFGEAPATVTDGTVLSSGGITVQAR
jgi:hypothetical protein